MIITNGANDESIEVDINDAQNAGRLSALSDSSPFYSIFTELQLDPDNPPNDIDME